MVKDFSIRYFNELKAALDSIDLDVFEKVINIFLNAHEKEKRIFVMGNGGSGSTASHFACDINKGVSYPLTKKFKVISLNDNMPLVMAYGNDISFEDIFVEQMKNFLTPGDVVIGISGSGNSKNVLKAIEYANKNGATTIGLSAFDGGLLAKTAQISLNVKVDDMQKAEDSHLILSHLIMQLLEGKLCHK